MSIDYNLLTAIEEDSRRWRFEQAKSLSERYVPGEGGNPIAMVIGEAPGAQEDVMLRPFAGPSGRVLRQLMASVGLCTGDRVYQGHGDYKEIPPNCWLTNVVPFRPPRNRTPTPVELAYAAPLLRQEWVAIGRPRVVVPVGGTALKVILQRPASILKMAGTLFEYRAAYDGEPIYLWPMIHPSFGLRQRSLQPLIERDWDKFGEWLNGYPF